MSDPNAEYERFIRQIADLQTDEEMDGDGWENDDCWETLHALIEGARSVLSAHIDSSESEES